MSNKSDADALTWQQQMLPSSWSQFIRQTLSPLDWPWSKFPKQELLKFCQSPKAPKLKQLLQMVPVLHKKYQQNCEYFRQFILLLHLLLIKGCAMTNKQFVQVCLSVLEQFLLYRTILVCSSSKSSIIVEVYDYIDNWLRMLVPSVFIASQMNSGKQKDRKKGRQNQKQQQSKPKTFLSILFSLNQKNNSNFNKNKQPSASDKNIKCYEDQLIVLFQCLLVSKIRNHLNHPSLFQFDNIMRRLYSTQKFAYIYRGKGCITHIQNKEKQRRKLQQQGMNSSLIQISSLTPARLDQLDYHVYDLQLQLPQTIPQNNQSKSQKRLSILRLSKIQSTLPMQQWIIQSFQPRTKPNPIKLSINSLLTKMKPIQLYRFLSLLQIYGSNPHIQVLNDYIIDEKVLQLFTKFLLGQNLVQAVKQLYFGAKENKTQQKQSSLKTKNIKIQYSYKSDKFNQILQKCMSQVIRISTFSQRNLLIKQFKTRIMHINSASTILQNDKNTNNSMASLSIKNKNSNGDGNSRLDDFWKK